ncbi:MAG: DUF4920 domain-containing protein [Bacteroidales bacterium]|nr:DUF4920 domain-containing protein [Bacteroidales bacterium]
MRYVFLLILAFLFTACCGGGKQDEKQAPESSATALPEGHYGKTLNKGKAQNALLLPELLSDKNTAEIKLSGNIQSVCQMTGCWLDMETGNGNYVHVTFENEAFVVPKDIAGKNATIEGVASKELVSVDLLKRQAKSEGKSQEEIDAITKPEVEYFFVATGVVIEDVAHPDL